MKDEYFIELVLARLEAMPDYIQVNLGSYGILEKAELIAHVKKQDKLGKKIVEVQMEYLRELKNL